MERGCDPDDLYKEVGIPSSIAGNEHLLISIEKYVDLLTATARELDDKAFSCDLARSQGLMLFSTILPRVRKCEYVSEAFDNNDAAVKAISDQVDALRAAVLEELAGLE